MEKDSAVQTILDYLAQIVDTLAGLNPGLDPLLWALIIFVGFGLLAVFSRKLIGLLVAAVIIAAGAFVAWSLLGG